MISSYVFLALASVAAAITITSPTMTSLWTAGQDQTVTWEAVSTDQAKFNIYLSNMAVYPPVMVLLASDVSPSAGSIKIAGSKLLAGSAFTINFTSGTSTEQIYAQSSQFNISASSTNPSPPTTTTPTSTPTPSLLYAPDNLAPTTPTPSPTPRANSTPNSGSPTPNAGGNPNPVAPVNPSVTPTKTAGAARIVAGLLGVIAAAALAL